MTNDTETLTGRHALVTGGGTGIGLAIAQELAARGAEVTITGRRAAILDNVAGPRLHPMTMDVTDEKSVRDCIAQAANLRGPTEICVVNAGIAEGGAFTKTSLADWQRVLRTNLDGAFLTAQAALGTLTNHDWGRMIFVSSIAGVRGLRGAVPYTASKHGMIGLMRGLSEEYLRTGITFNALCPGYVETDIVHNQVPVIARRDAISEDAARGKLAAGNRHKILLQTSEIATAALWLCQPGSGSVNGQTIQISGGQV